MPVNVVGDCGDQLGHTLERSSPDPLVGEVSEESFDEVEPGRTRRNEVKMKARVLLDPAPDLGMLVGGVVIQDEM